MTTELDLNTRAIVSGVVGTYDATESVKRVAVLLRWKRKLPKKTISLIVIFRVLVPKVSTIVLHVTGCCYLLT